MMSAGAPSPGRAGLAAPGDASEEFIARIDVPELAGARDRLLRLVAPRFAEETALGRYVRELFATERWQQIHMVHHRDGDRLSDPVFDAYGVPFGRRR